MSQELKKGFLEKILECLKIKKRELFHHFLGLESQIPKFFKSSTFSYFSPAKIFCKFFSSEKNKNLKNSGILQI